ncbi:hypothetical protein M404DRAFT_198858 [Pisolithus tinctorius Marx 270]|uniref:Uncharacterized protein n=1 Tax=Pisolithus tinctorius Marx 270 TaxID=870435 RepID=A0A0C3PZ43_PISTI|nr:hypothetical protein M404DRAFT_198858 [Pisolithus tinctorius Marx 270]
MENTNPTVFHGLLPALTVFTNADDDVETIIPSVQALTMALRAVSNQSEGIIFEVVLELGQGPVTPFIHDLLGASKVEGLHATGRKDLSKHVSTFASSTRFFFFFFSYLDGRLSEAVGSRGARQERVGRSLCRCELGPCTVEAAGSGTEGVGWAGVDGGHHLGGLERCGVTKLATFEAAEKKSPAYFRLHTESHQQVVSIMQSICCRGSSSPHSPKYKVE